MDHDRDKFSRGGRWARDSAVADLVADADLVDEELVEVEIVGESYRQETFAALAGPKESDGKRELVGVTLRCEPTNQHDPNAIRVEVMGQHVGYVQRELATVMARSIRDHAGSVLEARGLIVGGWVDTHDEGHYGIRVWITTRDARRLQLPPENIDPNLRPSWPDLPPVENDEIRISPSRADYDAGRYGSMVTVTCEEHYQNVIEATRPRDWGTDRAWPLLVTLTSATFNPHARVAAPCIEVRIGDSTVGYLTLKMSQRHARRMEDGLNHGKRTTAMATVSRGTKGGQSVLRLKVHIVGEQSPKVGIGSIAPIDDVNPARG